MRGVAPLWVGTTEGVFFRPRIGRIGRIFFIMSHRNTQIYTERVGVPPLGEGFRKRAKSRKRRKILRYGLNGWNGLFSTRRKHRTRITRITRIFFYGHTEITEIHRNHAAEKGLRSFFGPAEIKEIAEICHADSDAAEFLIVTQKSQKYTEIFHADCDAAEVFGPAEIKEIAEMAAHESTFNVYYMNSSPPVGFLCISVISV